MSDPLRLAIIGAGAVTQVAHLPVLKRTKGVEVVALADPDRPKARALADRFGIPGRVRGHRAGARLRVARCARHLLPDAPARGAHPGGPRGQPARLLRAAARHERGVGAADRQGGGEEEQGRHGGHEPPLPPRCAARPELRAERRAGPGGQRARQLARLPAQPAAGAAGASGATSRAAAPSSTSGSRCSTWACGWRATPTPVRVSATWEKPSRDRGVERSGSRVRRLRERRLDLLRRHLASPGRGRALRHGAPRRAWRRLDQPAHGVEGTARGGDRRVTHGPRRAGRTRGSRRTARSGPTSSRWWRARRRDPTSREHVTLHRVMDAIYKSAEDGRDVAL